MNEDKAENSAKSDSVKKPFYKKWWVVTIGVIILLGAIGSFSEEEERGNSSESETTKNAARENNNDSAPTEDSIEEAEVPAEATPEVVVTSINLSKEYSENEVAADEKYKGKIIEISGKVSGVDNGVFDNEMIIKLSDGQYDFNAPWCYMEAGEKEKVLAFKKGQQVTLIGRGESATMKSPILKECVVKD
jgi:hypothetical protein